MLVSVEINSEALDRLIADVLEETLELQENFLDELYQKESLLPYEEQDMEYSEDLVKAINIVLAYFKAPE